MPGWRVPPARTGMTMLVAAGLVVAASAAPVMQGQPAVRVTLSQSVGPPGGQVAVPIQLAAPEGVEVGAVTVTVTFRASALTFSSVALGGLAQGVEAGARATSSAAGEDTVLEVTIATPEKDGVRVGLPSGPLGDVILQVPKEATPESTIPLAVRATAVDARAGRAPIAVETRDGSVIVSNPTLISCFFYMH